jgi:DNA modification methylase
MAMNYQLLCGDCLEELKKLSDNSLDSCVTDPPYHLVSIVKRFGAENAAPAKAGKTGAYARASKGFMGKTWDGGDIAFQADLWREVWRVLKPGAHLAAMGATRGYHRMTCAIEDAGFEIRDSLMWIYGTGFPKSHDVSKGIDAKLLTGRARTEDMRRLAMGEDYSPSGRGRVNYDHGGGSVMNGDTGEYSTQTPEAAEWQGWGTALKPAFEPIVLARKPLSEKTVAANVLKWGTGAINIDGCRVGVEKRINPSAKRNEIYGQFLGRETEGRETEGRWPANVITDGSEEVVEAFPSSASGSMNRQTISKGRRPGGFGNVGSDRGDPVPNGPMYTDSGSAARFFYSAKASKEDRADSKHPTVKPIALMQYLVRLITPPNGNVLDPFAGTGTTGAAAAREGMRSILIEREKEYQDDIRRRMGEV